MGLWSTKSKIGVVCDECDASHQVVFRKSATDDLAFVVFRTSS
jgi:hypothetical protein